MKIVIIGLGKVGSQVQELCVHSKITVKAIISPTNPHATHKTFSGIALEPADTIIDFSVSEAALEHVQIAAKAGANFVMGTTGWEDQREDIERIIADSNIGLAFTPNYLPEVHLFWKMAEGLSLGLTGQSPNSYHGYVFEQRLHTKKRYSGTAFHTAEILEKPDGLVFQKEKHFASVLSGHKPLDIAIGFSSARNNFRLCFESLDAEGNEAAYAEMALKTAFWLQGKKGYFELDLFSINEIKSIDLSKV